MILGIDHMRDQPLGGQSSPDQSLGSGVLEDDAMTGAAGQSGSAGNDDAILRRYDVQPLALIVTDLKKGARAAGCSRHQGFDDARQMLRQLTTIGSALGSSLLACFGIGTIFGCFESRDGLIDILQNKLELISVQLFRGPTELRIFCKLEQPLEPGAAIQQSRGKDTQLGRIARQLIRQITHWPKSAMLRAPDAAKILRPTQVLSAAGFEARASASNPCRPEARTAGRHSSASRRLRWEAI